MKHIICLICFLLITCSASELYAKPLVADLDKRHIEIHSGFTGTDLLLFGARHDAGDIVVVVRGPSHEYVVRKKKNIGGIWINRNQITFKDVPGYYAIASSRPLEKIKNDYLLDNLDIGTNYLEPSYKPTRNTKLINEFHQALIDTKEQEKLYPKTLSHGTVSFIGDSLFRTIITFPDNIPRGTYTAEVYLFSGGQLSGMQSTSIEVKKTGLDAFIYDAAYHHSAIYGIIAIIIALFAGWLANFAFRKY